MQQRIYKSQLRRNYLCAQLCDSARKSPTIEVWPLLLSFIFDQRAYMRVLPARSQDSPGEEIVRLKILWNKREDVNAQIGRFEPLRLNNPFRKTVTHFRRQRQWLRTTFQNTFCLPVRQYQLVLSHFDPAQWGHMAHWMRAELAGIWRS